MIAGFSILLLGALCLIPLESWVHKNLHGVSDFMAEHVYLPLARACILVAFLLCVYPQPLFSAALLAQVDSSALPRPQLQSLLNWVFFAGLLLPLLPHAQRFGALILPLQAWIGAWLLSRHLSTHTGMELHSLQAIWGYLLGLSLLAHWVFTLAANHIQRRLQLDALSVYDSLALVCLPPMVLLYTHNLGSLQA